jgi:hypothetical protein
MPTLANMRSFRGYGVGVLALRRKQGSNSVPGHVEEAELQGIYEGGYSSDFDESWPYRRRPLLGVRCQQI